jgi:two-component system, response regulator
MDCRAILLVEDNPDDAVLARRALEKSRIGNELVVARDGMEALEYVFGAGRWAGRDPAEAPALVLLDLRLPKIDGLEVLRRIRGDSRTRMYPVVILTSSNEDQDMANGYALGANSYIRKPVNFDRFVEALTHIGLYWLELNEPPPRDGSRYAAA